MLKESEVELPLQLAARPPLPYRHPQIKFAFLWPFALPKDDEVVCPRQLSRYASYDCFIMNKLERVKPRCPAASGNVLSQLRHHAFAPLGGFNLAADVLAYLPVKIDQRSINGLKCPLPSGCNKANNIRCGPLPPLRQP